MTIQLFDELSLFTIDNLTIQRCDYKPIVILEKTLIIHTVRVSSSFVNSSKYEIVQRAARLNCIVRLTWYQLVVRPIYYPSQTNPARQNTWFSQIPEFASQILHCMLKFESGSGLSK